MAGSDAGYTEVSYEEVRTLLLRALLSLAGSAVAFSQTVVDPARVRGLLTKFEPQVDEQELRCDVMPIKPALNFSFRFQAGFIVRVPMNQYSGPGHRWAILIRVTPEGGDPVYLMSGIRLPDIPKTHISAEVGGGYLVGEGRYDVQWMMFDDTNRICRKTWSVEAKLRHSERGIRVALPARTVRGFSWFTAAEAPRNTDDAAPLRLTVLLHAAPLSLRRTTLRAGDSLILVGLLSSLLERLPTRSVRLVVFNLDQQKELFRQDAFSAKALEQVAQSINDLQLGVVDYRVLQNRRGHINVVADLVNSELRAKEPSDVVLFLGPAARYWDDVPPRALDRANGAGPQFFYFQYRPYYRRTAGFPDIITLALRKLRGKTAVIHSPGEFAKAIEQVERRVRPAVSPAAPDATSPAGPSAQVGASPAMPKVHPWAWSAAPGAASPAASDGLPPVSTAASSAHPTAFPAAPGAASPAASDGLPPVSTAASSKPPTAFPAARGTVSRAASSGGPAVLSAPSSAPPTAFPATPGTVSPAASVGLPPVSTAASGAPPSIRTAAPGTPPATFLAAPGAQAATSPAASK